MRNHLCVAILLIAILISCVKEEAEDLNALDPTDKTPSVIIVSKPNNNQVYASGDSIIVE